MYVDGGQRYGGGGIVPLMAAHIDLSMQCFYGFIICTFNVEANTQVQLRIYTNIPIHKLKIKM